MLLFAPSTAFTKDLARMVKRGYNLDLLQHVVDLLVHGDALPERMRDHRLIGDYAGHRECHILNDWLLVYRLTEDKLIATRTGTHSDLRLA
jgi:mRNA interferase YafQ